MALDHQELSDRLGTLLDRAVGYLEEVNPQDGAPFKERLGVVKDLHALYNDVRESGAYKYIAHLEAVNDSLRSQIEGHGDQTDATSVDSPTITVGAMPVTDAAPVTPAPVETPVVADAPAPADPAPVTEAPAVTPVVDHSQDDDGA